MLDANKILLLLMKKHPNEFIYLTVGLGKAPLNFDALILEAEEILNKSSDGSCKWILKYFCIPLLKELELDYRKNPILYSHLETHR